MLEFWKTIPRLVAKLFQTQGQSQHFIAVSLQPTKSPERNPYGGDGPGNKVRTDLEAELDYVQACLAADLECIVKAIAEICVGKNAAKRRAAAPPTIQDYLKKVGLGPSSIDTLLTKGRRYIAERAKQTEPPRQPYLVPVKVRRLAAIGDVETLQGLADAHTTALTLVGRARWAAQATAKGIRTTFRQVGKNKRRTDKAMSRDILDGLPQMSIMEMTCLAFVSGVNPSRIWQYYHGDPATIDYYRVFDLAVFAGRLSRGEPAPISWDLVRYLYLHGECPNIASPWRVSLFPNTVDVHHALEWICARIETICGLDLLKATIVRWNKPGQAGTVWLSDPAP